MSSLPKDDEGEDNINENQNSSTNNKIVINEDGVGGAISPPLSEGVAAASTLSESFSTAQSGSLLVNNADNENKNENSNTQQQQHESLLVQVSSSESSHDEGKIELQISERNKGGESNGEERSGDEETTDDDADYDDDDQFYDTEEEEYEEVEEEVEEDVDSEVLLAKEMALAIAKNPTMTPSQLRELQQQVQNDVEEKKKNKSYKKKITRKIKKLKPKNIKKKKQKQKKRREKSISAPSIDWNAGAVSDPPRTYAADDIFARSSLSSTTNNSAATDKSYATYLTSTPAGAAVKETYKDAKSSAKAGAKIAKKELKKGLRAFGLISESQTKVGIAASTSAAAANNNNTAEEEAQQRRGSISPTHIITRTGSDDTSSLDIVPDGIIALTTKDDSNDSGGGHRSHKKVPIVDSISAKFGNVATRVSGIGDCEQQRQKKGGIRLDGIVWKRRQGLGKYSTSSPWEKRRIILHGTKLVYYKTLAEQQQNPEDTEDDDDNTDADANFGSAGGSGEASFSPSGWISHINSTILDKKVPGITLPWDGHGGGSIGVARGYIDLKKERASVAASYAETGAPTPFALSIKVASVSTVGGSTATKWKLCFATQQELMTWLAGMTEVIISGSVDDYNAQILEANDPSTATNQLSLALASATHAVNATTASVINASSTNNTTTNDHPSVFTWHEPPPSDDDSNNGGGLGGGGHRLWSTGQYLVKSECYHEMYKKENNNGGPHGKSAVASNAPNDDADDNDSIIVGSCPDDYIVDTSSDAGNSAEIVGIPYKYTIKALILLNIVVLVSRSPSALSNTEFWYMVVFFNVLIVNVVNKFKVGGTVKLKRCLEYKYQKQQQAKQLRIEKSKKRKLLLQKERAAGTRSSTDLSIIMSTNKQEGDDDEDFLPPAGSTSIQIENAEDIPTKDGIIFAGWREADPSTMLTRSYGYKSNRKKIPCPGDLYRCIEVDIFESKERVPDMASRVVLPNVTFDGDDPTKPKTWNAPDLFVITIALPTDPPKLYGGSTDNGGGFTITMYLQMRQETRDILRRVTADGYIPSLEKQVPDPNQSRVNAVRLFDEWCRRAPSDDTWMAKFKVIPRGDNLSEIGLPTWISKYNGKPFLIKRPGQTGFLYRHPEKSCMEFDVSLHPFPYLAKQGICYMKEGYFKSILATFGFCIEASNDDELPECLIGLFQLCYPDPVHAIQAEEFFAGKSARTK